MTVDPSHTMPRPTGGLGVTRFATRGDHRLSYESSGATDGIPVLGLHDLLADRGQLRPLAETLPARTFRLTLPDARGHGASPMISGRAYPAGELVADALAVLDAEGLAQVHIAAIGWGAGIALELALTAPGRIASLALAEPLLPTLIGQTEPLQALREAAVAAEKGQADRALDVYFGMHLGANWRDGLPKPRLGAMRRAAGSLAPLLMGMVGPAPDRAGLAGLARPVTLLLRSGPSPMESDSAAALTALLAGARVETLMRGDTGSPPEQAWTQAMTRALLSRTVA